MGSLYDYGVPAMATGLTNLFNAVSADKARQAQINAQKIDDTVKLNALKKDMEQEERLNKYINVQGLLTSQGLHPDDAKSTIEEWRSMGWVDDGPGGLPRMQVRNAEAAFKHLDNSPKWKIAIAQRGFQRAQNFKNQINEEQQKILEKDPVFGYKDEKYTKLEQQKIAIDKEIATRGKQIEQAKLLFEKTDTTRSEAEIRAGLAGEEARQKFLESGGGKDVTTQLVGHTPEGLPVIFNPKAQTQTVNGQPYSGRVIPKAEYPASNVFIGVDAQGRPLVMPSKGTPTIKPVDNAPQVYPKPTAETPEKAAKEEAIGQGLDNVRQARKMYLGDDAVKPKVDWGVVASSEIRLPRTKGRQASTLILNAVEAKLRAESGAAVPESEVKRIAKRFIPQTADDENTIIMKLNNLESYLQGTANKLNVGRPEGTRVGGTKTPKQEAEEFFKKYMEQ
jgi:hypothetical protein